jgi:hypothetical protein
VRHILTVRTVAGGAAAISLLSAISCMKSDQSSKSAEVVGVKTLLTTESPDQQVKAFFTANFPPPDQSVADIAGYNDEQRFPGSGTDDYGGIVRLYVAPRAPTSGELATGAIVALVEVQGGDDPQNQPPSFQLLHLQNTSAATLYCVILQETGSPPHQGWNSFVTPVSQTTCGPTSQTNVLSVSEEDDTQHPSAYVARFIENNAGLPAIGVGCGTSFCHLGRAVNTHPNAFADDQHLAMPVSLGSHNIKRGIHGSITPVDGLGGISFSTTPTLVATITLDGPPDPGSKAETWGLTTGVNGVFLSTDGTNWKAQFVPGTGQPTSTAGFYTSQNPHPSTGPHVPPVARWAWSEWDEEIWVACEQGCCTIDGSPSSRDFGRGHKP